MKQVQRKRMQSIISTSGESLFSLGLKKQVAVAASDSMSVIWRTEELAHSLLAVDSKFKEISAST